MTGTFFRTLFSRFLLILVIIGIIPLFIVALILPKEWLMRSKFFFAFVHFFYRLINIVSLLPIKVVGAHHVPNESAIFVANHQSSLDIPLVGALVGNHPHVWLAKEELMDSWFLSIILPRLAVLVDQNNPHKAMRSLVTIIKLVNGSGAHLMIFPEGARFTDGQMHEFFSGFVIIAKKTGRPVVPVRIFGVHEAYPPDAFFIHYNAITVVVGEPMRMGETEEDEAFKQRVFNWFLAQKEE